MVYLKIHRYYFGLAHHHAQISFNTKIDLPPSNKGIFYLIYSLYTPVNLLVLIICTTAVRLMGFCMCLFVFRYLFFRGHEAIDPTQNSTTPVWLFDPCFSACLDLFQLFCITSCWQCLTKGTTSLFQFKSLLLAYNLFHVRLHLNSKYG